MYGKGKYCQGKSAQDPEGRQRLPQPRPAVGRHRREPQLRRAARGVEGLAHASRAPMRADVRALRRARQRGRARARLRRPRRALALALRHDAARRSRRRPTRLWRTGEAALRRAALLRARASSRKKYGKDKVPRRQADPGAPARQHVGAGVGPTSTRPGRAVPGRPSSTSTDAAAGAEVRRGADGEVRRVVLHLARPPAAAGDLLGALDVHAAARPRGRVPRQRVGRGQRNDDLRIKMCIKPDRGRPRHDPPRARARLLLPSTTRPADALSGRRQRRLPRGHRRRDRAVDHARPTCSRSACSATVQARRRKPSSTCR